MADFGRAASFLPTIKCSSCARDIEISQMGDHICGPSAGEPTPPPDNYGNFDRLPYKQNASNGPGFLKPGRAIPPRVDTSAANIPFFPQDQVTPVSSSPSQSVSPITPRSPFSKPLRSATAPLQQRALPSPEILSSNFDSPFPIFPTPRSNVVQKRPPPDTNGYVANNNLYAEPDHMYAPVSPRIEGSKGLLQRMNTIAPGPFDMKKRQKPGEKVPERSHQRNANGGSLGDATKPPRIEGVDANRPSTANPAHNRSTSTGSNDSKSEIVPPRVPRQNGYGGFGPPSGNQFEPEPIQSDSRSQTFPLLSESREPLNRRPSEPYNGPASRDPPNNDSGSWQMDHQRHPSELPPRQRNPSISGPDLTRRLPPRGTSLIRPRTATKPGDVPPIPEVNLADEFGIGNPYHTPTVSQSSSASGYSDASKASSRSSPPRPSTSQSRRKPSDVGHVDNLMSEIQSSMADLQPRGLPSNSSPPRKRAPPPAALEPIPRFGPLLGSPESPMDPAFQSGRLSPLPLRNPARSQAPQLAPRNRSPAPRAQTPQPDIQERSPARRPSRPTTAKGNCKGCGEVIKGKSISSADGRLTGRYHKNCFVCKTCVEPFQTATFYVIDDAPYCERHYHKLNGSVCSTCDRGIEGQYLESEGKQKFHPECLRCSDCKRNLRHDYFEMNGRVYCERDAFRRAQTGRNLGLPPGAGTNRMERRTTRLMMM